MAEAAGEERPSRGELEGRFSLPVITTSSMDYQKLAGVRDVQVDGPAAVWGRARSEQAALEGTEIPELTRVLHRMTLAARAKNIRRYVETLVAFGVSLDTLLTPDDQGASEAKRAAIRGAFEKVSASAPPKFNVLLKDFDVAIKGAFETSVAPQLGTGAAAAAKDALATATKWGQGQRDGGMHWATYRATVRRDGEFRLNMNVELTEPVFRAVSVQWEQAFVGTLNRELATLKGRYSQEIQALHGEIEAALV
jgi:hypothetical protein